MAAAAVIGVPSFGDTLKLGFAGFKKSHESTGSEGGAAPTRREGAKDPAGVQQQASALFGQASAWADKARKAVADKVAYDAVPQEQPGEALEGDAPDVERGEAPPMWNAWAKQLGGAASAVKKQVAEAAEASQKGLKQAAEASEKGLKQGVQKARSLDLGEPAAMVSKSMSRVADSATSAGDALKEKSKVASQKAQDMKEKSSEKLKEAKSNAANAAAKTKDKATAAAGAAKNKLSEAGHSVTGAVGGIGALAMSPKKLATFVGIFFVGCLLITLSFSFLPLLPIAPQKFALLFAFGSMVIMGSLAYLKGPKALATQLAQREKLPFSGAYVVGLVGTLVGTIVLRSFILTAVFGIIQAIALLYFLASYVPGGKAVLNFCGKWCSKLAQKALCKCRR